MTWWSRCRSERYPPLADWCCQCLRLVVRKQGYTTRIAGRHCTELIGLLRRVVAATSWLVHDAECRCIDLAAPELAGPLNRTGERETEKGSLKYLNCWVLWVSSGNQGGGVWFRGTQEVLLVKGTKLCSHFNHFTSGQVHSFSAAVVFDCWFNSEAGLSSVDLEQSQVKLATLVKGDPKTPFTIATTSSCRRGHYSFPRLLHLTLDPYLIMLSVKQGGIKCHF